MIINVTEEELKLLELLVKRLIHFSEKNFLIIDSEDITTAKKLLEKLILATKDKK